MQHVSLGIYSTVRTPTEIAAIVGIEADQATEMGTKLAAHVTASKHSWFIRTRTGDAEDRELDEQLAWLLDRFPNERTLSDIRRAGDSVVVWIYTDAYDGNTVVSLSSASLSRIAQAGAELLIDIYSAADS